MPREPIPDARTLVGKSPGCRLARPWVALDPFGSSKTRSGVFQLGEHIGTCGAGIAGELEVADVIQRELPASARVLEGLDFNLERPQIGIHVRHRNWGAPGVEEPARIAGCEVAELPRDEFRVRCPLRV